MSIKVTKSGKSGDAGKSVRAWNLNRWKRKYDSRQSGFMDAARVNGYTAVHRGIIARYLRHVSKENEMEIYETEYMYNGTKC